MIAPVFLFQFKLNKMANLKSKTYRIVGDSTPLSLLLQSGKNKRLLVFDSKLKTNRAIRHCPNEKSIYIDEQSANAVCEPIIFETGFIEVGSTQTHTQEFLDKHPDNVANGGIWFEYIDEAAEAKEDIERDELIQDIKTVIREQYKQKGGIAKLEMAVSLLFGSLDQATKLNADELKRVLYNEAETNPEFFTDDNYNVNIFDDQAKIRKYLVLKGLKDGVIAKTVNGRSIVWGNDRSNVIYTAPIGKDIVESFALFLETDDGLMIASELAK